MAARHLAEVVLRRCRYTLPGLAVALVLACLSFTPSLLPRPAYFQGLITGIDAAIGYGLGLLGAWTWREFADRPAHRPERRSWTILGAVAGVALVVSMLLGIRWQRRGSALVDVEPAPALATLLVPVIAVLVFVALVALARAVRTGYRRLAAQSFAQMWSKISYARSSLRSDSAVSELCGVS